jgi:hypothetical protein
MFAQQDNDPEYQAMRAAKDRELAQIAEERRQEQEPLLSDLAKVGVVVDWIGQLLELPAPDERIYPVLLDHIARPYRPWLLEWIGRAFGHRSARRVVWDQLLDLIRSHALEERAAEGVMVAISEMARPEDTPILIDLLSDPSLGRSRTFLVRNLMRSKRQEARTALLRNQADPDLTKEISARLSQSRS